MFTTQKTLADVGLKSYTVFGTEHDAGPKTPALVLAHVHDPKNKSISPCWLKSYTVFRAERDARQK